MRALDLFCGTSPVESMDGSSDECAPLLAGSACQKILGLKSVVLLDS
jgi:hypothetical protein